MKLISLLSILTLATMLSSCSEKQTDKSDFQVYLCFGQSNMAGAAKAEAQDSVVDPRFKVMSAMKCAAFNQFINQLPEVLPNSYVISSEGCPGQPDGLHFTAERYRILGKRYGDKMLSVLKR
jgi:hypothetical protein